MQRYVSIKHLYSGYWSCWSLSSTGDWFIFFLSPIKVILRRFLLTRHRMTKALKRLLVWDTLWECRDSQKIYLKNHLKFPVTILWIASFTLNEKCFGRQRWPSLLNTPSETKLQFYNKEESVTWWDRCWSQSQACSCSGSCSIPSKRCRHHQSLRSCLPTWLLAQVENFNRWAWWLSDSTWPHHRCTRFVWQFGFLPLPPPTLSPLRVQESALKKK